MEKGKDYGVADGGRIRFARGETDIMPPEMASYVLARLYGKNRKNFANYMRDYYLDAPGGPGVDRQVGDKNGAH